MGAASREVLAGRVAGKAAKFVREMGLVVIAVLAADKGPIHLGRLLDRSKQALESPQAAVKLGRQTDFGPKRFDQPFRAHGNMRGDGGDG